MGRATICIVHDVGAVYFDQVRPGIFSGLPRLVVGGTKVRDIILPTGKLVFVVDDDRGLKASAATVWMRQHSVSDC